MTLETGSPKLGEHVVGCIPVRNLWLLMLYASGLMRYFDVRRAAVEENPDDIPDVIARILCYEAERRLKRNLSYGYRRDKSVLSYIRGRVDLVATQSEGLLARGMVACSFDDLTTNTARNRLVRTALETMARTLRQKDRELARRCGAIANALRTLGVLGDRPNRIEIGTDRIGRHDEGDQRMVIAAMLAFNLALPTEEEGERLLGRPDREISWVRCLYEKAIAGFYEVVLSPDGWHVEAGKSLNWLVDEQTPGISAILPRMRTDVVLENRTDNRRIIVDTKFKSLLTKGWYREETIRSADLYQIYAYIRSQESEADPLSRHAAGLLLHPSIGEMIDESAVIQRHAIRFATVDLAAEARDIRKQLRRVVEFPTDLRPTAEGGEARV